MSNSINNMLYYFIQNYPYPNELSKTRITKMVYLADWFNSQRNGKQITDINWFFDHYGPYVSDVYMVAKKDENIIIRQSESLFGNAKELFTLKDEFTGYNLTDNERNILDEVINNTKFLSWNEFIKYVYETYPIKSNDRYTFLNLPELASIEKSSTEN